MTSAIKLWLKSVLITLAIRMAYRGEYLISLVTMMLFEATGPIIACIIYFNSPGFAGWTLHQVLLLQGIFILVKGISFAAFFGIVWNSNFILQKGNFDFVLLKPRNPLFMFMCQSFDAEDTAKVFGGMLLIGYSLFHIPEISLLGIFAAVASIILGFGLFFSMALLFSSFIFRFVRSWRVYEFLGIVETVGQYPKEVYPKPAGAIFTALLPIFTVAVFPAQALFGTVTSDILISAIAVAVLVFISIKTWFAVINRYSSAGG